MTEATYRVADLLGYLPDGREFDNFEAALQAAGGKKSFQYVMGVWVGTEVVALVINDQPFTPPVESEHVKLVLRLQAAYQEHWRDQPEELWLGGLVEELKELKNALKGEHSDSPDHELVQIASIALNWLEHRGADCDEIEASLSRNLKQYEGQEG
jgi:hypothetical protein